MSEQTQYVLRTQSNFANTFGVGEVVIPGVTLFRAGHYDLTEDEMDELVSSKQTKDKQGVVTALLLAKGSEVPTRWKI
jgi:hypothetical protein